MKTYPALLWGLSVLVLVEPKSVSVTETSSIGSTTEPGVTVQQLTAAHVHNATEDPTQSPADGVVAPTAEASGADDFKGSTDDLDVTRTPTDSPAETTAAREVLTYQNTAEPTRHQQPPSTSTDTTAAAASSLSVSWLQSVSTTEQNITPYPTTSSHESSSGSLQTHSNPSGFSTITTDAASVDSTVFDLKSPSTVRTNETSTSSTELLSSPSPVFTSQLPDAARSSSTEYPGTEADSTTTNPVTTVSTSLVGILIPHVPTPKSTQSPPSTEAQPCSNRVLMKRCLIAIASLAGLATIFMMSTIILCAKLSTSKSRIKKPQRPAELMCISSLLPETNQNHVRRRSPVTNGVLVIHNLGDSDDDVGNNFPLSSFRPDNESYV